jgi:hypothetical protein
MPSVRHAFDADCSPVALWSVLADLRSVAETNPMVKSVEIIDDRKGGVGAMRRCELVPKGNVTERVFACEEGHMIGLEVVESDWPVVSMSWKTEVTARPGSARLEHVLDYQMKFGPLGWFLNALVMRRALQKNVGEALKGVIRVAEART